MKLTTCILTTLPLAFVMLASASAVAEREGSTPVVTAVEPARPIASSDLQTITVTGEDFLPDLSLEIRSPDGQARVYSGSAVDRRNGTRFDALVQLPAEGRYLLIVTNTDGGVSEPFGVTARKAHPAPDAPEIQRIVPQELQARPEAQTVRAEGQRFAAGLAVLLTDPIGTPVPDVAVANVSPTSFTLTARFETRGDYELVATNRSGGASNVVVIPVR